MKTPGEVAYTAFVEHCRYQEPLSGRDMPIWAFLPDDSRAAWEVAAKAAQEASRRW